MIMNMNNLKLLLISLFVISLTFTACKGKTSTTNDYKTAIVAVAIVEVDSVMPTVNFYIENSGSMDGFVNRGNDFTKFITTYLTDISINFTDSVNLNYINSKIIPIGKDLTDFTNKLDATSFKQMGGNRGETHIFQLLDAVLNQNDKNIITIFITDGIFSPGRGKDASRYVTDQYNGIKKSFSDFHKRNPNAAVVVYQLSSQFNGTFFDRHDIPFLNTKDTLPYYIWLIGDSKHLNDLMVKVPESKYTNNGVENVFSIKSGGKSVDYAIKKGSGVFDLDKTNAKTTINNLKIQSKGNQNTATFSVNANLSGFLLSDSYLSDVSNYEWNLKDYSLTINKALPNNFGYTHELKFESAKILKGDLFVKLKTQIPQWVEEVHDEDGEAPIKSKTYGIKYQINGVYEAFTLTKKHYTEIKIKIN